MRQAHIHRQSIVAKHLNKSHFRTHRSMIDTYLRDFYMMQMTQRTGFGWYCMLLASWIKVSQLMEWLTDNRKNPKIANCPFFSIQNCQHFRKLVNNGNFKPTLKTTSYFKPGRKSSALNFLWKSAKFSFSQYSPPKINK